MMDPRASLKAAQIIADASRARLARTADDIKTRLEPDALARDAMRGVRRTGLAVAQEGVDTARRNPGVTIGVAAIAVVLALRRPITRLFRRE